MGRWCSEDSDNTAQPLMLISRDPLDEDGDEDVGVSIGYIMIFMIIDHDDDADFVFFLWTNLAIFGDDDVGMAMVISLNLCGFKILNALSVKISIS